jgi:Leucine-rich repeat (LRR) protein
MFQVSKLSHLKILNLSHNCIVSMEGLKELKLLSWLSLASNSIKGIEQLNQNVRLEHLDLSDNAIPAVTDISHLKNLKVSRIIYMRTEVFSWPV